MLMRWKICFCASLSFFLLFRNKKVRTSVVDPDSLKLDPYPDTDPDPVPDTDSGF
jgi:hypothetical protein